MDEEQDELESDSKEEEVVQAETNAEEALRLVGRQVKPDTWRTKAEGKTWKHVADNPSLVKHLSAIKDVPKDVSFTNIVAVKVDLEDTSGSIAVDQEAGQVEHDIRGIDGDLTSDECLRAFTYLFRTYPMRLQSGPLTRSPSQARRPWLNTSHSTSPSLATVLTLWTPS